MKNTKRLLTWILVAVLVVMSIALVACVDKPEPVQLTDLTLPELKSNQMAVIIKNGDNDYTSYVVTLGKGGTNATTAEGVLAYLEKESDLTIEWIESDYGKYINSIGKAKPTADGEYVEVFTSVESDMGTWAGVNTYLVGEIEIKSAAVGVTQLSVEAGAIIYFQISVY